MTYEIKDDDNKLTNIVKNGYEPIIGLEVHAELLTETKIFCSCSTRFGSLPNTQCCPVCLGLPGVLPVLNRNVVEYAIKAGIATNCSISGLTKQDRKNYFYPDLPKGYQISQYDLPICTNGYVEIDNGNYKKKIRIHRIHIEEDAGKLLHDENSSYSFIDYNRAGVPLIEIVSEPDISSAKEAKIYLEKLKSILLYIGVSDCKMEEGSLRVDVNISVKKVGNSEFGERVEVKNLNSFKSVFKVIESEIIRQMNIITNGGKITRETRRWDDITGSAIPMRNKEDAQDYRYFPEPDLPPFHVKNELINKIKSSIPELPWDKKERYIQVYGLTEYEAYIITSSKELAEFFEQSADLSRNIKSLSNWIIGDLMGLINDRNITVKELKFTPQHFVKLVSMVDEGTINGLTAKNVLEKMFETGEDPLLIVAQEDLGVLSDEESILKIVRKVIANNPSAAKDCKNGKGKAVGFLMGQIMKETKGKADPQIANKLLQEEIMKKSNFS